MSRRQSARSRTGRNRRLGGCAVRLLLALGALSACGPLLEETASDSGPPPADRESWGMELHLHEPDVSLAISAAYVADDVEGLAEEWPEPGR